MQLYLTPNTSLIDGQFLCQEGHVLIKLFPMLNCMRNFPTLFIFSSLTALWIGLKNFPKGPIHAFDAHKNTHRHPLSCFCENVDTLIKQSEV